MDFHWEDHFPSQWTFLFFFQLGNLLFGTFFDEIELILQPGNHELVCGHLLFTHLDSNTIDQRKVRGIVSFEPTQLTNVSMHRPEAPGSYENTWMHIIIKIQILHIVWIYFT